MSRSRLLLAIGVVVIAVAIGGFIVYDQVLRGDSAAALTLPTASSAPAAEQRTGRHAPRPRRARARLPRRPPIGRRRRAHGTSRADSVAGYRVREQLANLPAESDAVGRTDQVTGSITLETSGSTTTLTAGALTVDTTSITSDKSQRDNRLRGEGLQTDQLPDRHVQADRAGRDPGGRPRRDGVGRHPDRRPDAPRRHEVGRRSRPRRSSSTARSRSQARSRSRSRTTRSRRRTSAGSSSRSPTTARSSSSSTSRRADRAAPAGDRSALLRVDAARDRAPRGSGAARRPSAAGVAARSGATATSQPIVSRTASTVAPGWSESSRISPASSKW